MSVSNKQSNFIDFINHLLTFNKQQELFQKQKQQQQQQLQKSGISRPQSATIIGNAGNAGNAAGNAGNMNMEDLPFRFNISAKVVIRICDMVLEIFKAEANILFIEAPLYIFGDIHGQFSDLVHFLEMGGLPPDNRFLFLGDYVDRGNNSIEVCMLLFAMKILFPEAIYLIRGNHECPEVNRLYGLYTECETRFGGSDKDVVFNKINEVLCALPLCAVVNNKIFCVHGGISPHLDRLDDINKITRFGQIPDAGLLCDLMWADPTMAPIPGGWGASPRGISCTYNAETVAKFLKRNKLQLICRAHQLVSQGYKFFADNKLVTVFSAPNYCGNCGNDGAVMKVSADLVCSFIIIKPTNENESKVDILPGKNRRNRILDKIDY
jgi:serine/threonine-protein phosphatase PP1 catalytic subunit